MLGTLSPWPAFIQMPHSFPRSPHQHGVVQRHKWPHTDWSQIVPPLFAGSGSWTSLLSEQSLSSSHSYNMEIIFTIKFGKIKKIPWRLPIIWYPDYLICGLTAENVMTLIIIKITFKFLLPFFFRCPLLSYPTLYPLFPSSKHQLHWKLIFKGRQTFSQCFSQMYQCLRFMVSLAW